MSYRGTSSAYVWRRHTDAERICSIADVARVWSSVMGVRRETSFLSPCSDVLLRLWRCRRICPDLGQDQIMRFVIDVCEL
jgi:hypothetical protein